METLPKILESKTRIQYHDCDPFNHLNNSRYIDYMMAARTEQLLEQYGFSASEFAYSQGIGWVSAQTQISYFSPASWMEMVTMESRLIQFSEYSLLIEGFMWDENKTKLKAAMWAKLVHFNIRNQTSFRHSEQLMQLFSSINSPLEYACNFEERMKSIKPAV